MTRERQALINKFQKWLDTNPRKQIIAAQCANIAEEYAEQLLIQRVSNSKANEREEAYLKHFRDDPQFRGRSYRLRDNYIFHKDEAYECIDYYLRTGIKP